MREVFFSFVNSQWGPKLMPLLAGRGTMRKLMNRLVANPQTISDADILELTYPLLRPGFWRQLPEVLTPAPEAWKTAINRMMKGHGFPVTTIWGMNDTWSPPPQGETLCSRFRSCQFTFIEGVGHLPQMEAPEKFSTKLITSVKL